jgi:hypothetical protein
MRVLSLGVRALHVWLAASAGGHSEQLPSSSRRARPRSSSCLLAELASTPACWVLKAQARTAIMARPLAAPLQLHLLPATCRPQRS